MQEGRSLLGSCVRTGGIPLDISTVHPIGKSFIMRERKREKEREREREKSHGMPLSSAELGTENRQLRLPLWLSAMLANNALTILPGVSKLSLRRPDSILGLAGHTQYLLLLFSHSVVSDFLQLRGL